MDSRVAVVLFVALLPLLSFSGCLVGPSELEGGCDAASLARGGTDFFSTRTLLEGGVAARPGAEPDPRTTAWVLIATRLADRSGQVGVLFDGRPHADWLIDRLPDMMTEGTGVDSVANNLSLVRAGLQSWGRDAGGIELVDPEHPRVRSLADAWMARYDEDTGFYGQRLNEHVFAGFAARVFTHDRALLDDLGRALDGSDEAGDDASPYENDAWYAGYARALLGPEPVNASMAASLDGILSARQNPEGGVKPFPDAPRADASTTAAALLAWQASGRDLHDGDVQRAVSWLCGIAADDGGVPFSPDMQVLRVKTTAEVVIALSLFLEPIPWPEPAPGAQ